MLRRIFSPPFSSAVVTTLLRQHLLELLLLRLLGAGGLELDGGGTGCGAFVFICFFVDTFLIQGTVFFL